MPFLEIHHFELPPPRRARAAQAVTAALASAYGISAEIISIYFLNCTTDDYAHAGVMPVGRDEQRMFVKVHGFPRPEPLVAEASRQMTAALAQACDIDPENIAIYFLHRAPAVVAHGGVLASQTAAGGPVPAALAHVADLSGE